MDGRAGARCIAIAGQGRANVRLLPSPPPVMVGVIVQHLAEWQAHAVIVVPDTRAFWFPAVQEASIRSIVVAPSASKGRFQWPSHREGLKNCQYPTWRCVHTT